MKKFRYLLSRLLMGGTLCLASVMQALGGEPFWLGADVAGATMNEKMGHKLYDAQGKECE